MFLTSLPFVLPSMEYLKKSCLNAGICLNRFLDSIFFEAKYTACILDFVCTEHTTVEGEGF